MTFNVNFGTSGDEETLAAIAAGAADFVFLQETTEPWEVMIRARLGADYPHMAFRHCCRAGGLGVLSKVPFDDHDYLEPPEGGWFPAWRVVVHTDIGPLQVLNVHLRPQLDESGSFLRGVLTTPPIRLAEIERYHAALDEGFATLIVGDFNENGRGRAVRFLEGRGMKSAVPATSGATPTWRWQTSLGTITEQLDHVVFGPPLELVDVTVLERGNSDHLPVVATLRRDKSVGK
jgi:endonuclease/exonuclease/phosphatase family metal-dependent hydrolase